VWAGVVTLFPEMFDAVADHGITARALDHKLWALECFNPRDHALDRHRSVDDRPYGGGEGMVFMPGPLFEAIESCLESGDEGKGRVVLLSPQGKTWSQDLAAEYSTIPHLILVCGRYEGVDQRVIDHLVDQEISIGDFVLTGGEIPAMVLLDSIVRLIPGALGCRDSALNESFSSGLLDYPQYTRPAEYRGHAVPEVLLSGDHARIAEWRKEQALEKTKRARPELITER